MSVILLNNFLVGMFCLFIGSALLSSNDPSGMTVFLAYANLVAAAINFAFIAYGLFFDL